MHLLELYNMLINIIKKEKKDGSYLVKCSDETKGIISKEETNICVFSKENEKNRCESESTWSVEKAAEYICE